MDLLPVFILYLDYIGNQLKELQSEAPDSKQLSQICHEIETVLAVENRQLFPHLGEIPAVRGLVRDLAMDHELFWILLNRIAAQQEVVENVDHLEHLFANHKEQLVAHLVPYFPNHLPKHVLGSLLDQCRRKTRQFYGASQETTQRSVW